MKTIPKLTANQYARLAAILAEYGPSELTSYIGERDPKKLPMNYADYLVITLVGVGKYRVQVAGVTDDGQLQWIPRELEDFE